MAITHALSLTETKHSFFLNSLAPPPPPAPPPPRNDGPGGCVVSFSASAFLLLHSSPPIHLAAAHPAPTQREHQPPPAVCRPWSRRNPAALLSLVFSPHARRPRRLLHHYFFCCEHGEKSRPWCKRETMPAPARQTVCPTGGATRERVRAPGLPRSAQQRACVRNARCVCVLIPPLPYKVRVG